MKKNIPVVSDVYRKRREILAKNFLASNEAMLILSNPEKLRNGLDNTYPYRQDSNFFYLTGIKEEGARLLLYKNGNGKVSEYLFVQFKDPDKEKWTGYRLGIDKAREISGVDAVFYLKDMDTYLSMILNGTNVLYINYNYGSLHGFKDERMNYIEFLKGNFPHISIKNALDILSKMRVKKETIEIKFIREAIRITKNALYRTWRKMRPGMYEYELKAILESEFYKQGGEIAFNSIVASGEAAVVLHYNEAEKQIQDGELILFDVGAEFGYYSADISRTVPVNGKFSQLQKQYYNIVWQAQRDVMNMAKAGVTILQLNDIAKKTLAKGLIEMGKIKDENELSKYYYHGVGHHLGLDTHDLGGGRDALLPVNAVITDEPGLYIKEDKIGIRIEDDILIKRNKMINLSQSIISSVDDIEKFFRR